MAAIRVLQIVPAMNAGGMETFIMNVYRTIDREKVLEEVEKICARIGMR